MLLSSYTFEDIDLRSRITDIQPLEMNKLSNLCNFAIVSHFVNLLRLQKQDKTVTCKVIKLFSKHGFNSFIKVLVKCIPIYTA